MVTSREISKVFSLLEPSHQPTMLEQLKEYTHFQLLVATLLSARTKDTTIIPIVKRLFQKYPQPHDLAKADIKALEQELFKSGFYRAKARHVKALSTIVHEQYHDQIPQDFTQLIALPGVGRKTANCILNYAFHQSAIAVDIHVHRISNRLGWVKTKTPEGTEEALQKIVPRELWNKVNMLLVDHGQRICLPRKPQCGSCAVRGYCKYGKKNV